MNKEIIITTSNELGIKPNQVEATLKLLMDGNTVPFIARYRKEATGALNEEEIRAISEKYEYQVNLLKRKEDVIRLIDEKGLLNEELKQQILNAKKLVEIEDLYRPYKEKKKTKATDAINNGLEPLAKKIMSFPITGNLDNLTKPYINEKVVDSNNALLGASYIIAEWISDNANYRKWMRSYIYKNGIITTKKKKDSIDLQKTYEMYYDYSEKVKEIKPHRILAINRAEKEKIINVSIVVDEDEIAQAMLFLLENQKVTSEGSGAVSTAAIWSGKYIPKKDENVVCIISGGNIDINTLYRVIDTGLVKCGRRYTFRTHIVDRPGGLSEVTRILTDLNANILSANMSKLSSKHGLGSQAVELTIETFDEKHKEEIRESIIKAGFEISD